MHCLWEVLLHRMERQNFLGLGILSITHTTGADQTKTGTICGFLNATAQVQACKADRAPGVAPLKVLICYMQKGINTRCNVLCPSILNRRAL